MLSSMRYRMRPNIKQYIITTGKWNLELLFAHMISFRGKVLKIDINYWIRVIYWIRDELNKSIHKYTNTYKSKVCW